MNNFQKRKILIYKEKTEDQNTDRIFMILIKKRLVLKEIFNLLT